MNPYAVWVPTNTGHYLLTFPDMDAAFIFVVKFGGGLKVIENTYETF